MDIMGDKDITPTDLMNFMQSFKTSMEQCLDKNSDTMEIMMEDKLDKLGKKIDARLDNIDDDIKNLKKKSSIADDTAIRMDRCLNNLEKEMHKTIISGKRPRRTKKYTHKRT